VVSAVRLVAYYGVAQVTVTVRAETAAGVDEVIAMATGGVTGAVLTEPVVFTAGPPDAGGRVDASLVGAYLVGAVDAAAGVGALRYTAPAGDGWSSWHTVAAAGQDPPTGARLLGFPESAAVALPDWRRAVTGFAAGGGTRPAGVAWRPVDPGNADGEAEGNADVVGGLAVAIVQAADRAEMHRRPPGLPPPGKDLAGPDIRPGPVDAAVAAGHLRAAAELVAVARHRLRPTAGQQTDRLPWADPAARVGYAAEQLAGLVPAPAGPPLRLPAESVATAPSMDAVHRQFTLAVGEISGALRRLEVALTGPVPARHVVGSVLEVLAGAVDPLRELARPRDG
jgi:hypothetical protein